MMNLIIERISWVCICLLFSLLISCSDDNGVSTSEECTTSLPSQLIPASVNNDYFSSQNIPDEERYMVYNEVKALATRIESSLGTGGPFGIGVSFLNIMRLSGIQPDLDDNTCVWQLAVPANLVEQGDISVTVRGTPNSNGVQWQVEIDGTFEGESLDNFPVITGFTSNDEMSGEWKLYDVDNSENPVAIYTWDIRSEEDYDIDLTSGMQNSIGNISYTKDGIENSITIEGSEGTTQANWNEENDSGWIEDEAGRRCYSDFENSDCS